MQTNLAMVFKLDIPSPRNLDAGTGQADKVYSLASEEPPIKSCTGEEEKEEEEENTKVELSQFITILNEPAPYIEVTARSGKGDAMATVFFNDVPDKVVYTGNETEFGKLVPAFPGGVVMEDELYM